MEQEQVKFNFVITCEFNTIKQQFEVWGRDAEKGIESLMLIQTVDEIRLRLQEMILAQLNEMSNINTLVTDANS